MRLICVLLTFLWACTREPVPRAETPPPEYEAPAPAASPPVEVPSEPGEAVDAPTTTSSQEKEKGAEVGCVAFGSAPERKPRGYPSKPLADLSRDRVEPGGFDTEGFVVRHFVPAPCPPNAKCKPQPPPYLVLGDKTTGATAELLLETPKPKSFPIGKRYAVSVAVCGTQTYGGVTNEGYLLAAIPK